MRGMKGFFMASAAVACFSATQAVAQTLPITDPYTHPGFSLNVIGGGASFPAIVYREVFDCQFHPLGYGTTVVGPRTINPSCAGGTGFGANYLNYIWAYYVSTGSGNGKAAIKTNKNTTLSGPSNSIPYTSTEIPTWPYAVGWGYHYSGSDDIWTAKDDLDWHSDAGDGIIDGASPQDKFGNLIQLPGVAGAVAIALNGKDGAGVNLVQNGSAVSGSSSAINFTRRAMCGIFSGHITKWNNPILTASNGGVPMGTGQITVVHRFDGSGTNFLLTNALVSQCQYVTGPNNESDATVVSYAFPWKDSSQACAATVRFARGANQVEWPDQVVTCAAPANPTGAAFTNSGSNGTSSLISKVASTPGAIGYASVDYVLPVRVGGLAAANLQNEFDVSTNNTATPKFVAPTIPATEAAMKSVTPSFDSTTLGNPLAWSLQGVVPNPVLKDAYPIAGFSWIELYQCYSGSISAEAQLVQMLASLYAYTPNGAGIINANGFIQPPYLWLEQIFSLLNNASFQPRNVSGGGACAGKAGAI